MKNFFLFTIITLVACNDGNDQMDERTRQETDDACTICVLEKNLFDQKRIIGRLERTKTQPHRLQNLRKVYDSTFLIYRDLKNKNVLHKDSIRTHCGRRYPLKHVQDKKKRDALYSRFYAWATINYPIMDTTGGFGLRIIQKKDDTHKGGDLDMMEDEDYSKYVEKGMRITHALQDLQRKRQVDIAHKLTGLPVAEIDEALIQVLLYYCTFSPDEPGQSETKNDTVYQNLLKGMFELMKSK